MKKHILLVGLLVVIALVAAGCGTETEEQAAESVPAQPISLITEGSLLPVNSLDQSFAVSGQVAEVLVAEGETVAVGQTLAKLMSSPEALAQLAAAEMEVLTARIALDELRDADLNLAQARLNLIVANEELEDAQGDYDRNESDENLAVLNVAMARLAQIKDTLAALEAGSGLDPDQLAAAEARLTAANAALSSAKAVVEAHELTANMAGVVVGLTLQPGQRVTAGQPALTLADYSAWVIKTDNLTEARVVDVAVGQSVEILLDALPEQVFSGQVTEIALRAEEKRGDITYTVTVSLDHSDEHMRWGMTAAVIFLP